MCGSTEQKERIAATAAKKKARAKRKMERRKQAAAAAAADSAASDPLDSMKASIVLPVTIDMEAPVVERATQGEQHVHQSYQEPTPIDAYVLPQRQTSGSQSPHRGISRCDKSTAEISVVPDLPRRTNDLARALPGLDKARRMPVSTRQSAYVQVSNDDRGNELKQAGSRLVATFVHVEENALGTADRHSTDVNMATAMPADDGSGGQDRRLRRLLQIADEIVTPVRVQRDPVATEFTGTGDTANYQAPANLRTRSLPTASTAQVSAERPSLLRAFVKGFDEIKKESDLQSVEITRAVSQPLAPATLVDLSARDGAT